MKLQLPDIKVHSAIVLLLLLVATALVWGGIFNGLILAVVVAAICLSTIGFLKLGLYRQLLLFLALLQIFTFAIKVSFGIVNSTILALLPTIYLGGMLFTVFILSMQSRLDIDFSFLDVLVFAFFTLDFLQIFNPYLGGFDSFDAFIVGLRGFQQRSFYGLAYFVLRWLAIPPARFNNVLRILAYTAALGSAYALFQQLFSFDMLEVAYRVAQIARDPLLEAQYIARAEGFLSSPFTFGLICAIGLVSGIYLYNAAELSKRELKVSIVSILLNSVGIILSGSRSTYFSLMIVCVVLFFIMRMSLMSFTLRAARIVVAMLIAFGFLWVFFPESTPVQYSIERISSVQEIFAADKTIQDMNFIIRRELIAASIPMILSNPFGYGSGIFNGGSNPDGLVTVNGYSTFMDNEFVGLALELGVLGVVLFIAIIVGALYRCRNALNFLEYRDRARVLAALMVICPIAGVGGQWLAAYPINIIFWVVLGLISSMPTLSSFHSAP